MSNRLTCAVLALAFLGGGTAQAEELLITSETWEGGAFSYPEGRAQVTAIMLELEPGQTSPFHCHPVPTMGYVLEGTIEVETGNGRKKLMREGDPAVEVFRTLHRGRAVNGPVRIVVFYAGSEGTPTTVRPADDPEGKYCDPVDQQAGR